MKKNIFVEERRELIIELINKNNGMSVNDLAKKFNTTPVTIRKDLRELADLKQITRTHGGAVPFRTIEPEIELVKRENTNEKIKIAKKAVSLINDGDTICIDTGTTANYLAEELAKSSLKNLTIISSDLLILHNLQSKKSFNLICIGGQLRSGYGFSFGSETINQISKYRVDKYLLTTNSIDTEIGLSTPNIDTGNLKEKYIEISNEIILLADFSKFGKTSFSVFAGVDVLDAIIVDDKIDKKYIEFFENKNIDVLIAK